VKQEVTPCDIVSCDDLPSRRARAKKFFKNGGRFLPFLFTFGNAFFGFCSIALAVEGERIAAAYCIFISAMMDALDGRVARLMKVESEIGVELDSLCDAISFCLAPAYLAYVWNLRSFGFVGIVMGALFLMAGLFRLARFNVLHDEQTVFFIGLPTTIAGCFIVTVLLNMNTLLYRTWFSSWSAMNIWGVPLISSGLLVLLAWLMISSVRFPTFKKGAFRGRKHYHIVAAVVLFSVMAVMRLQLALLMFFISYFVVSLGYRIYLGSMES